MQEFLPVLIGMVTAGMCGRISSPRLRRTAFIALSLFGGAFSTTINSEWRVGLTAWLADTGLIAAGAVGATTGAELVTRLRRKVA